MGFPLHLAVSLPISSSPSPMKEFPASPEATRQIHGRMIRTQFKQSSASRSPAAELSLLLSSYIKLGRPDQVLKIYRHARSCNSAELDGFTIPTLLKACAHLSRHRDGAEIHGFAIKAGLHLDVFVQNALINMYSACGQSRSAKQVFDEMPDKDTVSWSTIIRSFTRSGLLPQAAELVTEMALSQVPLSEPAVLAMVGLGAELADPRLAPAIHGYAIKSHDCCNPRAMGVSSSSAMVDMYAKCGCLDAAGMVFRLTAKEKRNVAVWTAMVAGHVRRHGRAGLRLLGKMEEEDVPANEITALSLAQEIGALGDQQLVKWLHGYVLRRGFSLSLVLLTAMVDMYGKSGAASSARMLFDEMPAKDGAAWTAMLAGYVKQGNLNLAMGLLRRMMAEVKARPNQATMAVILNLCRDAGALGMGRWVHAWAQRERLRPDPVLATALIDMYANCGDLEAAAAVFTAAADSDTAMWNAMIGGLAMHGRGAEALQLVGRMAEEKLPRNHVTCVAALHACSHAGLVSEGKAFFEAMQADHGVAPRLEHYGCMVDLLARAGRLEEASRLIDAMPMQPNVAVWGALLAGCKLHKNAEIGEAAAARLLALEPGNCGYSVLLSNLYASTKRWGDVTAVRSHLQGKKPPGLSSIEVDGAVHWFAMGDDSHPQSLHIQAMMKEMMDRMKKAGYVPDTSAVLINVDEEEKETALAQHSEKLAIAFGLISIAPAAPIRVMKNLRICGDCHAAAKLLCEIYKRNIIIRDRSRFHHFSQGLAPVEITGDRSSRRRREAARSERRSSAWDRHPRHRWTPRPWSLCSGSPSAAG